MICVEMRKIGGCNLHEKERWNRLVLKPGTSKDIASLVFDHFMSKPVHFFLFFIPKLQLIRQNLFIFFKCRFICTTLDDI